MKRLSLIALVAAFVVSAFAFLASSAFAIPVFARKYNTQCNMCHTVPPRLNKFGVAYKENGFELPPGTVLPESEVYGNQVLSNDEPKAVVGAGFPFMIRTGLTVDISGQTNTTKQAFLGAAVGEFGMIGGGAVETPLGGLGFWIDAPGGAIGAIDFDFNFNPMFKVAVGTDGPKAGYALTLTPLYLGSNTRNPAVNQANNAGGFNWGNSGAPAIEVRGTTNPSTGLGLNYAVGYLIPAATALTTTAPAATASSGVYGHVAYFIDAANINIGVGYATQTPQYTGTVAPTAATSLLVDFAYGIGENIMVTAVYNKATNSVAAGSTQAVIDAATTTYLAIQPEFTVSPTLSVGGRYATAQVATAGATSASVISVGANYKLLQNVLGWATFASATGNAANGLPGIGTAGTAGASFSGLQAGIDFIF